MIANMTTSDFNPVELAVSGCPICGDTLENVESGQNCMGCGSRARLRSMVPLVNDYLGTIFPSLHTADQPLLAFAMTGAERKILSQLFKKLKSASLFGNYSKDHESGVDMRDLSRYAADSFSGVFGCLLFDYFPEHERALQECFRVIAPGGIFFTHIAPYRLVDGQVPPQQKGVIKPRSGYFEYLPEKADLGDVKVGRDWFVAAMKRVGFQSLIVRIKDAATNIVSEWFVGIKPGGLSRNFSTFFDKKNLKRGFQAEAFSVFQAAVPVGETGLATLKVELIKSESSALKFAEDHCVSAPDGGGEIREIVATNGSNFLYISHDLGGSWSQIYEDIPWDSPIRSTFSLANGGRLVRTFSGTMYHFDERAELVASAPTGVWHWHGSQGIGESATGTVMYAEYAPLRAEDGVQPLSVWRYRPNNPDQGWQRVLTLPASLQPPQGEIRHFHVCRPNPLNPSQWVLASGDRGAHCRLWFSEDDGDNWSEVHAPSPIFPTVPDNRHPQVFRFTQFSTLENGDFIWGTDDTSRVGCAALVRMSINSGQPVFKLEGWLGKNCIRNVMSYKDRVFLLFSESKADPSLASCILYDAPKGRIVSLVLPNFVQSASSVTDSLGSEKLINGVGFFPALGAVLDPRNRGIFRVSLKEINS